MNYPDRYIPFHAPDIEVSHFFLNPGIELNHGHANDMIFYDYLLYLL